MKPSRVDRHTTATVQMAVFFSTMRNLSLVSTLVKLSNQMNSLIRPVLVTRLKAIRNTEKMGMMMKMNINTMLGRIHT